jgi:hypothetical protein
VAQEVGKSPRGNADPGVEQGHTLLAETSRSPGSGIAYSPVASMLRHLAKQGLPWYCGLTPGAEGLADEVRS